MKSLPAIVVIRGSKIERERKKKHPIYPNRDHSEKKRMIQRAERRLSEREDCWSVNWRWIVSDEMFRRRSEADIGWPKDENNNKQEKRREEKKIQKCKRKKNQTMKSFHSSRERRKETTREWKTE